MVIPTRNATAEENLKESVNVYVRFSMATFTETMESMNRILSDTLLQQRYLTNELQKNREGEGTSHRGQQQQFGRLTRLEFPRFSRDDVKGCRYRCNQYFTVDNIGEDQKLQLASMHMYDRALAWHLQFVRIRGNHVPILLDELQQSWVQEDKTIVDSKYSWVDGMLKKKGKLVVGNSLTLRTKLISQFHDDSIGGHTGVQVTYKKMTTVFYWKGLKNIIKQ